MTQPRGQFLPVADALTVTVDNAPPAVALDASVPVNVTLRAAGEKWHDVTLTLFKDGAELARASVTRTPGSPDNQSASLGTIAFDLASTYEARVEDKPLSDMALMQLLRGMDAKQVLEATFQRAKEASQD